LNRPGKQGVATAFLGAFAWGVQSGYDTILAMDADFSHDPKYIPQMLDTIAENDMVIGSRNVKGGGIENRTWFRDCVTKCAALYCRIILGYRIYDFTGGYNMYRKEVFEKIGIDTIQCRGYSFQIEIKYKAFKTGLRIAEIPIIFPDRRFGTSKMSGKLLFQAILDVWKIKYAEKPALVEFIKFALTGGLGTITNLLIFFVCADKFGLPEIPVSIGCFFIAGTQNYIINHKWSFADKTEKSPPSIKQWALFLCASLLGLAINIVVMTLAIAHWPLPYKFIAQATGIAAGMAINFTLSKLFVWGRKNDTQ
jgi:dolichol-phosphate mannosyltransferase